MIRFFLKKTFWDAWDNLIAIILGNAAWVGLASLAMGAMSLVHGALADSAILFAACSVAGLHACALAWPFKAVAEGEGGLFAAYRAGIASTWATGLLSGALAALAAGALFLAFPYYMAMGGLAGAAAIGAMLWILAFVGLALQWMPAVAAISSARGLKAIRKCFMALLGNPGLSLFLAGYNALTLALSLPLALFAPGPAGMTLAAVEALRLDMLRYRWLADAGAEAREAGPWNPPWAELLAGESERMGARSLREALFFGRPGKRRAGRGR